jgi:molybdate transport system ATP-binding protein
MVFQQPSLFPHLSALDNVLFASPQPKRREAEELLERFHVSHVAKRRPIHLSGGEQQRVVIARALAARPRLLLLDEPLPGVDAATRASILKDLLDYQKEHEVPYLYVTHNRVEAIRLAGRVLLIEQGKIVADGKAEEVLIAPACVDAVHVLGVDNVFAGTLTTHHQEEGLSEIDLGGVSLFSGYTLMPPDSRVAVTIPSTEIVLSMDRVSRTSAQNVLSGTVSRIFEMNGSFEIMIETPVPFRAHISRSSLDLLGLRPGVSIHLLIKAIAIVVEPL